jgi:glycosyltransferase involved in cell wall biosynthesis
MSTPGPSAALDRDATLDGRTATGTVDEYPLDLRMLARPTGVIAMAAAALRSWDRHRRGVPHEEARFGELVARLEAAAVHRDGMLIWEAPSASVLRGRGRGSSAAQGLAASVLVRDALRTGDERRATQARGAVVPLLVPDTGLGLIARLQDGPVLVDPGAETAGGRQVLSSWIFGLLGLRDVAAGLGDARALELHDESTAALAALLAYYDTGWWTRRSLGGRGWDLATPAGHALHTSQIKAIGLLSGRGVFLRAAERWRRYDTPVHRLRARTLRTRRALRCSPRRPATGRPAHVKLVLHHAYPLSEPRGQREALAFRDAGLEVSVLCQSLPGEPLRERVDGIEIRRIAIDHLQGVRLSALVREYFGFTLAAARALAGCRADLVHVHTPPDFLLAAALGPRLRGAGLLLDIHDLSRDLFDARFGGGLGARAAVRLLAWVEWLACVMADRVVTVHEPYANRLVRRGVSEDQVGVVMNSIDERFLDGALAIRAEARSRGADDAERDFTVAYHGTVTTWYGLDLLVEAVARARQEVPGIRALIVGPGDALDDTRRLAEDLDVADRVDFVDSLPHREALERIAVADCGVVPNRPTKLNRFALSSKLFEYVALGMPVAVARLETLTRHFDADEVLFFDPGDAASLAAALTAIARDPAAAAERADRARARAAAEYSWARNRERLLTYAFELIPEPPSATWRPSWWTAPRVAAGD